MHTTQNIHKLQKGKLQHINKLLGGKNMMDLE